MSKRKHHILLRKELHYLSVFIGHMEVVLLNKLEHGALGELVNTSLTHESLLPCIHPKEEIEHHTCYRHKIKTSFYQVTFIWMNKTPTR